EVYINGLVEEGVIVPSEYPDGYNPNLEITRLEMSKMIARGLAKESLQWKEVLTGLEQLDFINLPFTDQRELNQTDQPYVALANGSGIVSGRSDGTFDADGLATRAQASVMLTRYLDAKDKLPDLENLLENFKGEKTIHDYSKEELESWIDREADLERLNDYPVEHDIFDSLAEVNHFKRYPNKYQDKTEELTKDRLNVVIGYMDKYFNRDYRTIGDNWIEDIRYYYRDNVTYNGVEYSWKQLPQFFDELVQETKNNKLASESIFVTDISMYHSVQEGRQSEQRVRGTQYIRYSSGTDLPIGIELNKWYVRDLDVQVHFPQKTDTVSWDTPNWVFEDIFPISSYEEVKL
ncbi:S-layer homology domain-containing protein, partial [Bacillus sp. SM2101]|uniref:S-layer homology domain-containing protein n=1 Tax=Bacillus sp. SM2101 TaxID=2805366 RepID=UPI001BDDF2CB